MIQKEKKTQVILENATHEGDTGSPEVQVAILTARINELTEHLRKNARMALTHGEIARVKTIERSKSPDSRSGRIPSTSVSYLLAEISCNGGFSSKRLLPLRYGLTLTVPVVWVWLPVHFHRRPPA